MQSPVGLRAFIVSTFLAAVAYAAAFLPGGAPWWAPLLLALGAVGTMVSAMALGASRAGSSLGPLRWVFGGAFVVLSTAFALALLLPPEPADAVLWLGLPRRAAILVYGVGLLPVALLPLAYAATFRRVTLSEDDIARFHARLAEMRARAGSSAEEAP